MIQFTNVAKTFRRARVLDGISLDIGLGERVALMRGRSYTAQGKRTVELPDTPI